MFTMGKSGKHIIIVIDWLIYINIHSFESRTDLSQTNIEIVEAHGRRFTLA